MPEKRELLPILAALLIAGCGPRGIGADWKRFEPGVAAIEFELPQLDGPPLKLSDYRGRVVVMEFWATWCGPCRFSLPSLEVIYKRHRDRGMTVLLINEGEEAESARKWAEKRFTAPILLDRDQAVGARYHVRGIPRLFIVDQAGNLAFAHDGYGGGLEQNLTLILDELLAPAADG